MAEIIFWVSVSFIVFTYAGYPFTLWIKKKFSVKVIQKSYLLEPPFVSVVIAVRNEQNNIRNKIVDICRQSYPHEKMELIIISDGSDDRTIDVVKEVLGKRDNRTVPQITLLDQKVPLGKPSALNSGIKVARGEIIVFADARQRFVPNNLRELVANFSDPSVGCVSGELLFVQESQPSIQVEMGAYWKYEKFIRKMESASGSVIGATGAIYAIRRSLFYEIPVETLIDDVLIPLRVLFQKYRVVFDTSALAYDTVSSNVSQEWIRKVRTLVGNWQLVSNKANLLNLLQNRYKWRFFWHKFARLIIPFALISLLISSLFLNGFVYRLVLGGQLLFYAIASSYLIFKPIREKVLIKLCYFFCVLNIAAGCAFFIWITGKSGSIWKK